MKKRNRIVVKMEACRAIVELNPTEVTSKTFNEIAEQFGLTYCVVKKAWMNFTESGGKYVDRRQKEAKKSPITKSVYQNFADSAAKKNKVYQGAVNFPKKDLSIKETKQIIAEYMSTKIKGTALCIKYQISSTQFYDIIHELEVTGNLCGFRVMAVNKYAKLNMLDVIRMYRWKMDTKTYAHCAKKSIVNLTSLEKLAYERAGDVLYAFVSK